MNDFTIEHPTTLEAVVSTLARIGEGAHVLAGGTDVVPLLRDGLLAPRALVSLRRVAGLDAISVASGRVAIGPRATLAQLASDRAVLTGAPLLARACDVAATPQIRNMATLAGNLLQRPRCWYFRGDFDCAKKGGDRCFAVDGLNQYHAILARGLCHIVHPSDPATALVALGARVHLLKSGGRRELALEDFLIGPETDLRRESRLAPGEVIERLSFPALAAGVRSGFEKVGRRADFTFALVNVAVVVPGAPGRVRGARVVLGGVAPVPWRSTAAEQVLEGQAITAATARAAARAALSGAKPLSLNGYKVQLAQNMLERLLLDLAA